MAGADPIRKVQEAEQACAVAAAAVRNPDDIPASQAVLLYERLERAGRSIAAAKTLLARRVAESGQWKTKGHSSAAEHLAQISGRSLGAARSELETSTALPDLDATKEALLAGEVSESQGGYAGPTRAFPRERTSYEVEAALRTPDRGLVPPFDVTPPS